MTLTWKSVKLAWFRRSQVHNPATTGRIFLYSLDAFTRDENISSHHLLSEQYHNITQRFLYILRHYAIFANRLGEPPKGWFARLRRLANVWGHCNLKYSTCLCSFYKQKTCLSKIILYILHLLRNVPAWLQCWGPPTSIHQSSGIHHNHKLNKSGQTGFFSVSICIVLWLGVYLVPSLIPFDVFSFEASEDCMRTRADSRPYL